MSAQPEGGGLLPAPRGRYEITFELNLMNAERLVALARKYDEDPCEYVTRTMAAHLSERGMGKSLEQVLGPLLQAHGSRPVLVSDLKVLARGLLWFARGLLR